MADADDKKEQSMRDVIHDLSNVIASIAGFAEFLKEDLSPDMPEYKFVQSIHEGSVEARTLVAKLVSGDYDSDGERNTEIYTNIPTSGPILLVEDQIDVREMMIIMLNRLGREVEPCSDALAAIDSLREKPGHYSLVITDHSMPGMTGADLAKAIDDDFPGLPVILMSGRVRDEMDAIKAACPSIRSVLSKPVDFDHLAKLVRG